MWLVFPLLAPRSGLQAEEQSTTRVEVTHSAKACDGGKWGCNEPAHHSARVGGRDFPDQKELEAALRQMAATPRKVAFTAEPRIRYAIANEFMELCRKSGLQEFEWFPSVSNAEKTPGKDLAARGRASEIWIRIEDKIKGVGTQIEDGPWILDDSELIEGLRAAGAGADTTLVFDPEGGLAWSEVARRMTLCAQSGLGRLDFMGLPASPPGYSNDISAEEATALARSLDQAPARDQPELLDHVIDRHEMMRRMMGATPLSVPMRRLIAFLFAETIPSGKTIRSAQSGIKPLRFLRLNSSDGSPRPLFRILTGTEINYVELILARRPDGEIRIVDLFNLSLGGVQTAVGRRDWIPGLWSLRRLNTMIAPTPEDFFVGLNPAFEELLELLAKKKYREFDALFLQKAEAFKRDPAAHRLHVRVAGQIDADFYGRAVHEMEKCFPDDPSLLVLKLGGALMKKDLKGTLDAADALDERLKGDPYLDVIRSNSLLEAGDIANARSRAAKAMGAEPELHAAWWLFINACLQQEDFKAVAEALSKMEGLNMELGRLEDEPAFAEFMKSNEYRGWLESRQAPRPSKEGKAEHR